MMCPFCEIIEGRAPATYAGEWDDAIAIYPLNQVTFMHMLVIPKIHVEDFAENSEVAAMTMARASQLARTLGITNVNLITSKGVEATQSVFHLHLHVIPRTKDDGLALPWHSGKGGRNGR